MPGEDASPLGRLPRRNGRRCSLIVLNRDGEDVITACIDSLLRAVTPDDEIIVVDNASTDRSVELLRDYGSRISLVELSTNTYIFGLNIGVEVADGRYVAFLNNDITVEPDFIDEAVKAFEVGEDVFAVCPRILQMDGIDQGSRTTARWKHGLIFYDVLPHVDEVTDCFFAVGGQSLLRTSYLREIGSIDPLLRPMYHEDIELCYRAWKRGWRVVYAPRAVVHHWGGHSSRRVFTPRQLRSLVRQNEFLIVWKNVTSLRLLAEHVLLLPTRLAAAAVKRDWATLLGFARATSRLGEARSARRVARRHAVISDREVLRRLARLR